MKLKDELYIITSRESESSIVFRIKLNPDSLIYKAHFPEMPVTPGVCIIQIAGELLSEALDSGLLLDSVKNAKFLNIINPGETKELSYKFVKLEVDLESRRCHTTVTVEEGDKIFAKLSLAYKII